MRFFWLASRTQQDGQISCPCASPGQCRPDTACGLARSNSAMPPMMASTRRPTSLVVRINSTASRSVSLATAAPANSAARNYSGGRDDLIRSFRWHGALLARRSVCVHHDVFASTIWQAIKQEQPSPHNGSRPKIRSNFSLTTASCLQLSIFRNGKCEISFAYKCCCNSSSI